MKLLVVGGGGREHAIIKKLKENPSVTQIIAAPGNGGIAADAVCVPVGAKDIDGLVALAQREQVDYAVVAPDDPLVLGAVDALTAAGIPCFGPNRAAAIIEGSKVFSKHLMKKYGIPTAAYETFDDMDAALAYLDTAPVPVVVKADGLALGKGVIIAQSREEAKEAVVSMMRDGRFGESGRHVVIEEFLTGPEVSVLSFTDGETLVPMVSSMDHKRALDGDEGLNTGGMGTIAPNPFYTDEIAAECMARYPAWALRRRGRPRYRRWCCRNRWRSERRQIFPCAVIPPSWERRGGACGGVRRGGAAFCARSAHRRPRPAGRASAAAAAWAAGTFAAAARRVWPRPRRRCGVWSVRGGCFCPRTSAAPARQVCGAARRAAAGRSRRAWPRPRALRRARVRGGCGGASARRSLRRFRTCAAARGGRRA